jgi:hypothetical protein
MPNWCANRLTVTGPAKAVEAFVKMAGKTGQVSVDEDHEPTGKNALDFNSFIELPEELKEIQCGSSRARMVNDKAIDLSPKEEAELIRKHGAADWYDWSKKHWGTKWNCSDVSIAERKKTKAVYRFQTAWSPMSEELLETMSGGFPELTFRYAYAEVGCGFAGVIEMKDRDTLEQNQIELTEDDFRGEGEGDDKTYVYKHDDEFAELVSCSG